MLVFMTPQVHILDLFIMKKAAYKSPKSHFMKMVHTFQRNNTLFTIASKKWQWGATEIVQMVVYPVHCFLPAVANKILNTSKDNHITALPCKVTFRTPGVSMREGNWNVYPTAAVKWMHVYSFVWNSFSVSSLWQC